MPQLQKIIDDAFERPCRDHPRNVDAQLKEAINTVMEYIDQGKLRVAREIEGQWVTHQWLKKAVLLSFRIEDNFLYQGRFQPLLRQGTVKICDYNSKDFREARLPRMVPPASVRKGSFIAKNVVADCLPMSTSRVCG